MYRWKFELQTTQESHAIYQRPEEASRAHASAANRGFENDTALLKLQNFFPFYYRAACNADAV